MVTTITATSTETTVVNAICDERNFYVDATGGDNGNDGRTPETAWKTIPRVNAESFVAGDNILFKRGETFAGNLYPTDSGDAGNPIVYGAYGAGARPIIDGSGSDYGALRIQSPTRYFRFNNLDFAGCSDLDYYSTVNCFTDNAYFYDCIVRDSAHRYGFFAFAEEVAGGTIHHITLDTCQFYNNYMSGALIGSVGGTLGPRDCLIRNSIAHNNGHSAYADHGFYLRHGVTIDRCISYSNPSGGGIKVNSEDVTDSPYTPIVRNCICYDNFIGIYNTNNNSLIYNNLTYDNDMEVFISGAQAAGSLFYFNTFVNCKSSDGHLRGDNTFSGVTFKNNIFVQDAAVHDYRLVYLNQAINTIATLVANNTFDYNIYYHSGTVGGFMFYDGDGTGHTFAQWQGYGADAHGIHITGAVPGFVGMPGYTGDYHPANGGNLDGHDGVAIVGYEYDFDENARADPPNIGCYEETSA